MALLAMRLTRLSTSLFGGASLALLATNAPFFAAPTEIQQPGTQPLQALLQAAVVQCDGCHGTYDQAVEPVQNWMGSMEAHAGRDPLFWASLAVADGDVPGMGDSCMRCHTPRGWHEGRATSSSGSSLSQTFDGDGVECAICHNMVNPNGLEYPGMQTAPFLANNGGTPPVGYHGNGMKVLAGDDVRHGPYFDSASGHPFAQSQFVRSPEFCGTCHDASNSFVGDLAPGNGAQTPLAPSQFSGVPNAPVAQKVQFKNPPHAYGVFMRTFSEHKASDLSSTPISQYATLPADVQRGAIQRARQQALLAGTNGNYEDGTTRYFNCQVCHMEPVVGEGAAFQIAPLRYDLPLHDLTGGNTWAPQAIQWLDGFTPSKLRLGRNLSITEVQAMNRGVVRARATLQRATALDVTGNTLRVTNLTGHKLGTGFPEGRRIWIRTRWRNEQNALLREDGAYGSFTATVAGTNYTVNSITDPNARVYGVDQGITQDWAAELVQQGSSANTPLRFDRATGAVTMTLGQLANAAPGTTADTFHLALNNKILSDNRIPPWRMRRADATTRNALPEPATQYGNPAATGVYNHFDDVPLAPPAGATRADVELLYQTASWEYVQFLRLANPGNNPFLNAVGVNLFDAYMATGRSAPEVMSNARWCNLPGTNEDLVLKTAVNNGAYDETCGKDVRVGDTMKFELTSPNGTHAFSVAALALQLHDPWAPPIVLGVPGLWLDHADAMLTIVGVPATGWNFSLTLPAIGQQLLRWQALAIPLLPTSPVPSNGLFALSRAYDFRVR